jgi:SpoVK/Ycf46/Vps4 family AAA+-type ATPase
MVASAELRLAETVHPTRHGQAEYEALLGVDAHKEALFSELSLILNRDRLDIWRKRHHGHGLAFLNTARVNAPLIVLSGDVGCGKTALAACVASPVARALDARITVLQTPSDIRGGGYVGELSSRLTEAFTQAKSKAAQVGRGILIIDEADDIATRRGQAQAHHEDRAGVNVLIKQIDDLAKEKTPMAVIMITNRVDVLDPAVMRRAVLTLNFSRPDDAARAIVFRHILDGTNPSETEIRSLVKATATKPSYTYSDLTVRLARLALRRSMEADRPFSAKALLDAVPAVSPSPVMEEAVAH